MIWREGSHSPLASDNSHLDPESEYLHGQMDVLMRFEAAKPGPFQEPAAAVTGGAPPPDPIPFEGAPRLNRARRHL
jgi:hypothetical protein